jgi:hypothetical protein
VRGAYGAHQRAIHRGLQPRLNWSASLTEALPGAPTVHSHGGQARARVCRYVCVWCVCVLVCGWVGVHTKKVARAQMHRFHSLARACAFTSVHAQLPFTSTRVRVRQCAVQQSAVHYPVLQAPPHQAWSSQACHPQRLQHQLTRGTARYAHRYKGGHTCVRACVCVCVCV